MLFFRFVLFLIIFGISSISYAADTGLKYGVLFGGSNVKIDDPEGDTNDSTSTNVFNVAIIAPLLKGKRIFLHGYNNFYTLDADTINLGQDVTITGLTGSLQFDVFNFVWVGGGVGIQNESYKNRHTLDGDGYTDRSKDSEPELANDSFITFPLVISLSKEYEINSALSVGAHITYSFSYSGRANYLSALVGVYF